MRDMRRTIRVRTIFILSLLFTAPACFAQTKTTPPTNAIAPEVKSADIEAAVRMLCAPADIIRSQNGDASGCKKCPKGTEFYGENMGEWELRHAITGHFTSANADNLIIDGFNCDSHAQNFGGSFIFSISAGKLRLLRYDTALITEQCHKSRYADAREFLVCQGGWSGQGENNESVFLARFDAAGKDDSTIIFTTSDATATCGDDLSVKVPSSGIKDIKFASKGSGELNGMTITATFGQVTCREVNAKHAPGKEMSTVKTYELHYNFDGKQFTIAPESKAALKAFPE
jgi:hypothetical protein